MKSKKLIDGSKMPPLIREGREDILKLVNTCWHPITAKINDEFYHWPAADKTKATRVEFKKIPRSKNIFDLEAMELINLPDQKTNVGYIMSRESLRTHPERKDFVAPGEQFPDADQKIPYCIGFLGSIK